MFVSNGDHRIGIVYGPWSDRDNSYLSKTCACISIRIRRRKIQFKTIFNIQMGTRAPDPRDELLCPRDIVIYEYILHMLPVTNYYVANKDTRFPRLWRNRVRFNRWSRGFVNQNRLQRLLHYTDLNGSSAQLGEGGQNNIFNNFCVFS